MADFDEFDFDFDDFSDGFDDSSGSEDLDTNLNDVSNLLNQLQADMERTEQERSGTQVVTTNVIREEQQQAYLRACVHSRLRSEWR